MSFDAALFRAYPPSQHGEWSTCPFTGLQIPKTVQANLDWRRRLIGQAKTSPSVRRVLKTASAASPIYWLNAFGWTFLQKKVQIDGQVQSVQGAASHVPFITWKVQDDAILELIDAIDNGHDALLHKSRDMGASWIVVAVFQWYFQFRPSTTFLELSRKEVLVDKRGDMDSLFEKHRYLMQRQPEWLRPQRLVDNAMHLENKDIGTAIMGESTNENAGQASRKTAILLDEFARVREGEEIDLATADTSACRIFNSTPQGPNTHFTRIFRQMQSKQRAGKLIVLPWWQHPEKGKDAAIVKIDDKEVVRNAWYYAEDKRRSKRNMAQNIDGEHGRSGDAFFDSDEIDKHRLAHAKAPLVRGNVKQLVDLTEEEKLVVIRKAVHAAMVFVPDLPSSPWRFWVPLLNGRPNQFAMYVFGVDISNGSGASNSVITVLDHETGMIVAKWWDAFTSPEELADIVALAAIWFGGRRPPLIVFEKNGPGVIFGRKLVNKLNYPNVYYQQVVDQKSKQATKKWGWHSSDTKKEILLGEYREALKLNQIINPCEEALAEAADYVYDSTGKIEPGSVGFEEGGGSKLHGDHVIADALCQAGRRDLPKKWAEDEHKIPAGTPAARMVQRRRDRSESQAWSR